MYIRVNVSLYNYRKLDVAELDNAVLRDPTIRSHRIPKTSLTQMELVVTSYIKDQA